MRVIPESRSGAARPGAASALPDNGAGPLRFIRGAIRGSPWVVIATTAHIVGIAVLSVIYVATHPKTADADTPMAARIVAAPDDDPVIDVPPIEIARWSAAPPAKSDAESGVVNVDEVIIPDALAGRPGEITPETNPMKAPGIENPDPDARPDLSSGATSGTSIGVGKIGHVGKSPSPFLSRFLGGGGPGGGGLGQKGDRGGGGPPGQRVPDDGILAALRWLRNHQSPDGHWDSDGFDSHCKMNRCDGPGEATYDPGLTGLALLGFLGVGETHQSGNSRETMKRGLKYLRDIQDSEGCFGPRTSQHFLYNHACAALAMTEAYGMTASRSLKEPAQRGIQFVLRSRNPYSAWRYNVPADGDNDTSVTGWMVMALKSAKMSGLDAEMGAVKDAIAFVDKMTEPEFGRTGYQNRGGPSARTNEMSAKFPASKSESMTAVGMTVRIFGGHDLKSDPMIDRGADLLAKCLPKWDVDAGTIDYYYWYYGSLAMFQVGGPRWKAWNDAVKRSLLDHQRLEKDRCEFGSWDPVDPWSPEGGRVYATAINCLTMEVYYRYPVLGVKSEVK